MDRAARRRSTMGIGQPQGACRREIACNGKPAGSASLPAEAELHHVSQADHSSCPPEHPSCCDRLPERAPGLAAPPHAPGPACAPQTGCWCREQRPPAQRAPTTAHPRCVAGRAERGTFKREQLATAARTKSADRSTPSPRLRQGRAHLPGARPSSTAANSLWCSAQTNQLQQACLERLLTFRGPPPPAQLPPAGGTACAAR